MQVCRFTWVAVLAMAFGGALGASWSEARADGGHGHDHGQQPGQGHLQMNYSDRADAERDPTPRSAGDGAYWWRGNLHTHTLWSDGDSFPEVVVDWYKRHGYHFLALSDHNILSRGVKWVSPGQRRFVRGQGQQRLQEYIDRFGEDWVETRIADEAFIEKLESLPEYDNLGSGSRRPSNLNMEYEPGDKMVRLQPLNRFRHLFERPGRFLLMESEEITSAFAVHVNATNIIDFIRPFRGPTQKEDALETMRASVAAVVEQRHRTGQPMFPHIAHPNFGRGVVAEDIARVEDAMFFEVYNGHPAVRNTGDDYRTGTDRLWDIVLTLRLAELDLGVMYGLAVDDAHEYTDREDRSGQALPGRGWIDVRARYLTPGHLIEALERGDFYASTGVALDEVAFDGERYTVDIDGESGVTYRTLFIGTREGYDESREPTVDEDGEPMAETKQYSDEIGKIFAEVEGTEAVYEVQGDEIYVRAKVVSNKPKENRYSEDEEWEVAWAQPVVLSEVGEVSSAVREKAEHRLERAQALLADTPDFFERERYEREVVEATEQLKGALAGETWRGSADDASYRLYAALHEFEQREGLAPFYEAGLAGTGSEGDPYRITNAEQLQAAKFKPNAHFVLTGDIDASETAQWNDGEGFEPIGTEDAPFGGSFEGAGYAVIGLTINRGEENFVGLFGMSTGDVRNLELREPRVTGGEETGAVAGESRGVVENVRVIDARIDGFSRVAGVAGRTRGPVRRAAVVGGQIEGAHQVGGVVGRSHTGTHIHNAYTTAAVSGVRLVGGLTGHTGSRAEVFEAVYAAGPVEADRDFSGLINPGASDAEDEVRAAYWDVEATGQSESVRGTPLRTEQMTGAAAREYMEGFDFDAVWQINDEGYPTLRR